MATGGGIPIGYSAVLLPQLSEENNSTLHVNRETGSWIGETARLIILFLTKRYELENIMKKIFIK